MKHLMSEEAIEARRRYMREWRARNKELHRQRLIDYWERKAQEYREQDRKEVAK